MAKDITQVTGMAKTLSSVTRDMKTPCLKLTVLAKDVTLVSFMVIGVTLASVMAKDVTSVSHG